MVSRNRIAGKPSRLEIAALVAWLVGDYLTTAQVVDDLDLEMRHRLADLEEDVAALKADAEARKGGER